MRAAAALAALLALPAAANAAKAKAPDPARALPSYAPSTAPVTVGLVLERFEEFDARMESLSGDFVQFVRWDDSGVAQSVEGKLEYRRPDRLRLEQRLPEEQTVVSDGDWLWIWRRSTKQVIKTRLEDWKKREPLARGLLEMGGYAGLLKRYEVRLSSVSAPGGDGHREVTLSLRPKTAPDEFELLLAFSTRDFFPARTELRVGAVTVRTRYSSLSFNPELPDDRFRFTAPRGADLFLDEAP